MLEHRDVLVPQLALVVAETADERREASAAVLLCLLGDPSHLGALTGLLASDRADDRLHALRLLGNLRSPFCDLDPGLLPSIASRPSRSSAASGPDRVGARGPKPGMIAASNRMEERAMDRDVPA